MYEYLLKSIPNIISYMEVDRFCINSWDTDPIYFGIKENNNYYKFGLRYDLGLFLKEGMWDEFAKSFYIKSYRTSLIMKTFNLLDVELAYKLQQLLYDNHAVLSDTNRKGGMKLDDKFLVPSESNNVESIMKEISMCQYFDGYDTKINRFDERFNEFLKVFISSPISTPVIAEISAEAEDYVYGKPIYLYYKKLPYNYYKVYTTNILDSTLSLFEKIEVVRKASTTDLKYYGVL